MSYGKGALVGVDGEMEHGGVCGHPMLGNPMRAAIAGGKTVISSNVKVAAAGASLDVPLGHKGRLLVVSSFRHDNGVGGRRASPVRDPSRYGYCPMAGGFATAAAQSRSGNGLLAPSP